jgi:hypothetical protein
LYLTQKEISSYLLLCSESISPFLSNGLKLEIRNETLYIIEEYKGGLSDNKGWIICHRGTGAFGFLNEYVELKSKKDLLVVPDALIMKILEQLRPHGYAKSFLSMLDNTD